MKNLSNFDTASAVKEASPDYSQPESSQKDEDNKSEVKDAFSGTFDAFEALGASYD